MIDRTIPIEYIPRFRYYKIAINELNDALLPDEFQRTEPLLWKELARFIGSLFNHSDEIDSIIEELNGKEEVSTMIQAALREHDRKIRKKAIEKGSHSAAVKEAGNFLKMGLTVEQVARGTGLTKAEIKVLADQG